MSATRAGTQRSILVTGAASGIGRATARSFAARGWLVGCYDIDERGLDGLEAELGSTTTQFGSLDVTDRTAVLEAVETFGERSGGRLDLLFNNAGIDAKGPFVTMGWDQIMAVVNVNLVGGMSLIHAALPLLTATDNSLCLSTASAAAIFGTANLAVYSATKHAVRGLTEALSVELAADGVRAADILPGIIDTGMLPAELKRFLPPDGPWRVLPAEAVAAVVWDAYCGDRLHWYIPAELAELDVRATTSPEGVRDDRIAGRLA